MMGMPMQMAQQVAQMPMQATGALAQAPQGIMQGIQSAVQQVGQMTEGIGKDDGDTDADPQPTPDRRDGQNNQAEQQGAAPGDPQAQRAPEPCWPPIRVRGTRSTPRAGRARHEEPRAAAQGRRRRPDQSLTVREEPAAALHRGAGAERIGHQHAQVLPVHPVGDRGTLTGPVGRGVRAV